MDDFDDYDDDVAIIITEKGAIMAQATPKLLGYGLTAWQILDAFGIDFEDEDAPQNDEEAEQMLGIMMYTARFYGAID